MIISANVVIRQLKRNLYSLEARAKKDTPILSQSISSLIDQAYFVETQLLSVAIFKTRITDRKIKAMEMRVEHNLINLQKKLYILKKQEIEQSKIKFSRNDDNTPINSVSSSLTHFSVASFCSL